MQVEDDCKLSSVDEIATAVHQLLCRIQEEAYCKSCFSCLYLTSVDQMCPFSLAFRLSQIIEINVYLFHSSYFGFLFSSSSFFG